MMTMMTFKQYLREETEEDLKAEADRDREAMLESSKIRALLLRDCAPFMKVCRRSGFMYRGIQDLDDLDPHLVDDTGLDEIPVYRKAVRTNRRPLNTSREGQVMYDAWFEKKFGYKARAESMFCFPERMKDSAEQYGTVCLVFPIGDFQYVWSPRVGDLQLYAEEEVGFGDEADVNDMLDRAGYKSTGLATALGDSSSEIMVRCKAYYAIPAEFVHDIHELVM